VTLLNSQLEEYFKEFDADLSGYLDRAELSNLLREFFARNKLLVPITDDFVNDVFLDLDTNHNGKVEIEELINFFGPFNQTLIRMFKSA